MDDLIINDRLTIPAAELTIAFARSGGPGGQNVNKVETKVELRWKPGQSAVFAGDERSRLIERISPRLTEDGDLIVTSSRTRDQSRNREDARTKLAALIRQAIEPAKVRRKTQPSRESVRRRLDEKRLHARLKADRRAPSDGEG
ncbi:MAG: alternative ribosome rescue aminoacyl-tRNA hydrolase ArfB [Bryobacterales bacterium]|nr:alternative ribosome rescue aminoacyl-tRNA hydrolase ArfB [Bryobacterales bacterium]